MCLLVLLLVALITTLAPLASADPPDPTWLGGYWDDDDFDNVIDFISRADAAVGLPLPAVGPPTAVVVALRSLAPPTAPPVIRAIETRAPPLDLSIV